MNYIPTLQDFTMNVLDFYSAKQYRVRITPHAGIFEERIDNDCYKELPEELVSNSEDDGNNDDEIAIYSKKPHKWGYKVFTKCGALGIVYNFENYVSKSSDNQQQSSLGITGDLVIRLCQEIPKHQNYKLCFDNYFKSLPLLKTLHEQGILAPGTIRANRMRGEKRFC